MGDLGVGQDWGPEWFGDWGVRWLAALRRQRKSPATERTWRTYVRSLGAFLKSEGVTSAELLTREHLHRWQDQLSVTLAPASQVVAVTAVRSLLKWADREKVSVETALWMWLDTPRVPEGLPRPLDPEVLAAIMAHYAQPSRDLQRLRDRALFWFLVTTSCRISEALQVRVDQVRGDRMLVRKKGGDEHLLVMSAQARLWVMDYLRARGRDEEPALWIYDGPVAGRRRLTDDEANRIWKRLAKDLGVQPFTSHQLKHTGVTELGEYEDSDDAVVKHVGWTNPKMMRRYRKLRDRRRQAMVDQLDALVPEAPPPPPQRPRGRRFRVV